MGKALSGELSCPCRINFDGQGAVRRAILSLSDQLLKKCRSHYGRVTLPMKKTVVVVALLFYVHGKHLRSWRDGQLT